MLLGQGIGAIQEKDGETEGGGLDLLYANE